MWFVATMMIYELVIYVTGGPHQLGPILGVTAAFIVSVDPMHRIWPVRDGAATRLPTLERRDALPSRTQTV